ncbi:hypothetical protein RRG08_056408 [Elysia crispata]|uniref:Uncharacterized protein n=1 Tax=Elysia crispata TaxID=231223 RepID=A0AAE0YZJ0_9GAST|nr:hypothetical protein RRG08_056408 [Elysia crispata]
MLVLPNLVAHRKHGQPIPKEDRLPFLKTENPHSYRTTNACRGGPVLSRALFSKINRILGPDRIRREPRARRRNTEIRDELFYRRFPRDNGV